MSAHRFQTGDRAIVARPEQPSGHRGGEQVTVLAVDTSHTIGRSDQLLKVVEDATGLTVGVWSSELDPVQP
ncbi:hypothetical protein Kpho02_72910 [Kitasatospora phosalacinea]|uniref:Uncharacterized protein n=1 Tax=Kitasatospora phosalacinea TaxID=2065 RepID=A0A9W6QH93_9ACTN|nr:hypothetical protein [Kitasatospora phosalacinea]GLW74994.1 hypothetical protein Kpho02_72910 [Kitasatospora phosalacinea]